MGKYKSSRDLSVILNMTSESTDKLWNNNKVVFYVQVCAALLVILAAIINLTVPQLSKTPAEQGYWKIALGSTIGYLFPSPIPFGKKPDGQ